MISLVTAGISVVGSLVKSWLDNRKVKAEGKIAITKAEIAAKVTKIEKEAEMDIASVGDMRFSWKDEWFVLLLSMPFIGAFIPPIQPYIRDGFLFLKDCTPEWYQWAFLGAIVASFGLRTWTGWKK